MMTLRRLARLKEDILTFYTNYVGKKTKENTTVKERQTPKELKANPSIIVKPSDKCKGFVIMDGEVYADKDETVLNDPDGYEKLKRDPTK